MVQNLGFEAQSPSTTTKTFSKTFENLSKILKTDLENANRAQSDGVSIDEKVCELYPFSYFIVMIKIAFGRQEFLFIKICPQ